MTISLDEFRTKLEIGEDSDFKVKEADQGFPKGFWSTYSAFANTQGGLIVLGVKESKRDKFELAGLNNIEARQKELWDCLQNKGRGAFNTLSTSGEKQAFTMQRLPRKGGSYLVTSGGSPRKEGGLPCNNQVSLPDFSQISGSRAWRLTNRPI